MSSSDRRTDTLGWPWHAVGLANLGLSYWLASYGFGAEGVGEWHSLASALLCAALPWLVVLLFWLH